jgi:peptide deformylase
VKIRCYPDDVLRKRAEPVAEVDDDVRRIAAGMLQTMDAANGVGLAAPQVGLSVRLCVLNADGSPEGELALVNPEIVDRDGTVNGEEGCLSFPGIYIHVRRNARITVRYRDLDGAERQLEAEGLLARAIQHEVDHLDGVLLVDKMTPVDRLSHRRALKMLERRFAGDSDAFVG